MNEGYVVPQNNKTNNKLLYIIIALLVVIILGSLALLKLNNKVSKTRTIMIYMVGSDLESRGGLATSDLNSLDFNKVKGTGNNVVILAGGSKRWYNSYIDSDETSIYTLTEGGIKKAKSQDVQNMGKPDVLSNFLNYVYDNYKTDEYDLIFWDHGAAIMGSEFDELNNYDNLSLTEFKEAFDNSPFKGNNKLELIVFRTCMNATLETANLLSDYSNYLVASEEVTIGANQTSVLNFVNDINKTDNAVDIGKKFIKSYQKQVKDIRDASPFGDSQAIYSTYALINLQNAKNLVSAVNDFFGNIDVKNNFNQISKARASVRQYGSDEPAYDVVDLYSLVDSIKDISSTKANKVITEFNNTVIYNWATNPESRGISIYFPYGGSGKDKQTMMMLYSEISGFDSYKSFIKNFDNLRQSGGGQTYTYSINKASISSTKSGEADFEIKLTKEEKEKFALAKYLLYEKTDTGYYKIIYSGGTATLDGDTLKATIRDRQLRVLSKTDKDDKGYTLLLKEVDNNGKYIKYQTQVILNRFRDKDIKDWLMDRANINLLYDKKTKKIGVLNVMYADEGRADTAVVDLSKYDNVEFSLASGWDILDANGHYVGPQTDANGKVKGDGIMTGWEEKVGNYKFELEKFEENREYYGVFAIKDVYGNITYSDLIKMK